MNEARARLLHLQDQNDAAGEQMKAEAGRFARIAGAEPTRAVQAFNLFQTPPDIAERLAAMLAEHIPADGRILEPSAGLGRLYHAARSAGLSGDIVMVEQAPDCCRELYEQHAGRLIQADFLTCDVARLGGPFAGVLMNPPFKQGRDIKHIRHALTMLAPGGTLIALCYDGVRQRRHIAPIADSYEPLPAGAFKAEGTNAAAAIVRIIA